MQRRLQVQMLHCRGRSGAGGLVNDAGWLPTIIEAAGAGRAAAEAAGTAAEAAGAERAAAAARSAALRSFHSAIMRSTKL